MFKNKILRDKVNKILKTDDDTLEKVMNKRVLSNKKKKLRYFIFLFLFSLIMTLHYIFFYSNNKDIFLQEVVRLDMSSPIISTPIIIKEKKRDYLYVATTEGDVFSYDIPSFNQRFEFSMLKSIIAPLSSVTIKKPFRDVLVFDDTNQMVVVKSDGNYRYTRREESYLKGVISKPLIFNHDDQEYVIAVDIEGNIEAFESSYGEILWQQRNMLSQNFTVSGIAYWKKDNIEYAIILSQSGKILVLNAYNGEFYYSYEIGDKIYSSSLQGYFKDDNELVVVTEKGTLYIFDLNSKKMLEKIEIGEKVVSSPFLIEGYANDHIGVATLGGNLYELGFDDGELKKRHLFKNSMGGFRSSPSTFDFNGDGRKDVLLVDFVGNIFILDTVNEVVLSEGLSVNAEVTATSLINVYNEKIYVVISTEKSMVHIYEVKNKFDKNPFLNYNEEDLYLEFLKNNKNQNR